MTLTAINVVLRGGTMLARFVLLVAMARYLTPADVGLFALFSAASLWGVYLQGLEFHLFNLREIVASDRQAWARRTRDAFALYSITFLCAVVVWASLFQAGLLPWRLFGWFLATLAFEHVAQESYRLLILFGRPLAGSLVLFARNGGWMYAIAAMLHVVPSARSLDVVFAGWVVGGASSALLAFAFLRRLPWRGLPTVDWAWMRRGLTVALPLLCGSLAFRGIALFERAWLAHVHGDAALGVYGFYATIAGSIPVLADSGVGVLLYPQMMRAWKLGDAAGFRDRLRRLTVLFAVFLAVALPSAFVAVRIVVQHLRVRDYAARLDIYVVLLASAALWAASAVPQYALWARGRDRSMIAIPVIGLVAAIILDVALIPRYAALGAAYAQLAAMALMFVLRLFALRASSQPA